MVSSVIVDSCGMKRLNFNNIRNQCFKPEAIAGAYIYKVPMFHSDINSALIGAFILNLNKSV